MPRHRLAYLLFVIVGFAELGALLAIGHSRFSRGGALVLVFLIWRLGRRSRIAWWLFVLSNAWVLISSASFLGSSGGHVTWGNVIALSIGSALLLAILLGPDMRAWVKPTARRHRRVQMAP